MCGFNMKILILCFLCCYISEVDFISSKYIENQEIIDLDPYDGIVDTLKERMVTVKTFCFFVEGFNEENDLAYWHHMTLSVIYLFSFLSLCFCLFYISPFPPFLDMNLEERELKYAKICCFLNIHFLSDSFQDFFFPEMFSFYYCLFTSVCGYVTNS